jgi:DNA-binding transcriptional ArsR family regulator
MTVISAIAQDEIVQQVADYFSVLGEPMRLRLLNLLKDRECCVQELVEATATSQANVSKHLKVMLQAGILARRTQGTLAYYRVADRLTFELCTQVCDRLALRIKRLNAHHQNSTRIPSEFHQSCGCHLELIR